MSFFQQEMDRLAKVPPPLSPHLANDPKVREFMTLVQNAMICWEPWLIKNWPIKQIDSLGLSHQYLQTLEMTSAACLEDLEQYSKLYQLYRDHKKLSFEDFFSGALAIAEKQGFKWEGPMDNLPFTPTTESGQEWQE